MWGAGASERINSSTDQLGAIIINQNILEIISSVSDPPLQ